MTDHAATLRAATTALLRARDAARAIRDAGGAIPPIALHLIDRVTVIDPEPLSLLARWLEHPEWGIWANPAAPGSEG